MIAKYSGATGIIIGFTLLTVATILHPSVSDLYFLSSLSESAASRPYFIAALVIGAATSYIFFRNYVIATFHSSPSIVLGYKLAVLSEFVIAFTPVSTDRMPLFILHIVASFIFIGSFAVIAYEFAKANSDIVPAVISKERIKLFVVVGALLFVAGLFFNNFLIAQIYAVFSFWSWMITVTLMPSSR